MTASLTIVETVASLTIQGDQGALLSLPAASQSAVLIAPGAQGPQGPPGASGAGFTFTQAAPATTWTVNHNLGFRPGTSIYTTGGVEVEAAVTHTSVNQLVVSLALPLAGYVRCA